MTEHCDHCEREFSETEDTFVSDTGGDICAHCAATWLREERTRLAGQLTGAVRALEAVRDYAGRVCDQYETCDHRACQSSHAAWEIANRYLTGGQ